MRKRKTLENVVFSRVLSGTGDRIRTNDTPGMNRIFWKHMSEKIPCFQGFSGFART